MANSEQQTTNGQIHEHDHISFFFFCLFFVLILFTLGLERKIYRNEMITGKDKKVTQASHSRASGLQARLLETSSPKNAKARGENAENSLIFYCEFKTVLTDQVRANNHKYKYTKSKQLNIRKG